MSVEANRCLLDWKRYKLETRPLAKLQLCGPCTGGGTKGKFLQCIHACSASYCAKVSQCLPYIKKGVDIMSVGMVLSPIVCDRGVYRVQNRTGFCFCCRPIVKHQQRRLTQLGTAEVGLHLFSPTAQEAFSGQQIEETPESIYSTLSAYVHYLIYINQLQ